MTTIGFSLGEERNDFKLNVTFKRKSKSSIYFAEYLLKYPCEKSYECTYYQADFPRGRYKITICGANGGVLSAYQKDERKSDDFPYAAGCTSGIIDITKQTKMYIHLGGYGLADGNATQRSHGGYNGGGSGNPRPNFTPGSGGGEASDIRADVNDLFHRIIVAGGGGGGDDEYGSPQSNDGAGGSGGGLTAQGWHNSVTTVDDTLAANQTFGFSFGQGEASTDGGSKHPEGSKIEGSSTSDLGGAGGGWFGGFASHHFNYGGGGGSSFALTEDAVIPDSSINVTDENYTLLYSETYAFYTYRMYLFYETKFERGVWFGNGYAQIKQYKFPYVKCAEVRVSNPKYFLAVIFLLNK